MKYLLLVFAVLSPPSWSCTLAWDRPADYGWLEGYRIYQGGVLTHTLADSSARSIDCATAGLTPSLAPITATSYRGTEESPQSDPASFTLRAPVSVSIKIVEEIE